MKTSRILTYAIVGVIAGLLIENKALVFKQNVNDTTRKLKKKLGTKPGKSWLANQEIGLPIAGLSLAQRNLNQKQKQDCIRQHMFWSLTEELQQ